MAASDDDAGDRYPYNGKVMLAAIISLSVAIFFVLLLHAYARWLLHRRQQQQRRSMLVRRRVFLEPSPAQVFPGQAAEARLSVAGVDPKVVAALPVFVYRAAEHEHGVECVVCLSAMEEEESGRRLPECTHAFHVGCIDMWLASHATCPICRSPVRSEEAVEAEVDAGAAAESEEEMAAQVEELCAVANGAGEIEVVVDTKELDESSSSSSSPSVDESTSSVTSSPPPTSFGSSLMRMLSRGRSQSMECKI